jgi:Leucine rich repeat
MLVCDFLLTPYKLALASTLIVETIPRMEENSDRRGSTSRDLHVDEPEDDDNNNSDSGDEGNGADNDHDDTDNDEESEGGDGTAADAQTVPSSGAEDDAEPSNHSSPFAYPALDDNSDGRINDEEPLLTNDADGNEEDSPVQPKNEAVDPMIKPLIICIVVATLVAVIVFPILYLVVLPNSIETTDNNNDSKPPKDDSSTEPPNEEPTSNPVDWSVLQLPGNLTAIIEEDEMSSAAQAYRWLVQDPNIDDYTPARREQRFSLAGLYYATGGENWLPEFGASWLEYGTDECQWGGLSCDAANLTSTPSNIFSSRHRPNLRRHMQASGDASLSLVALNVVQGLSLSGAGLRNAIPPELFLLTGLRLLAVSGNKLVGPLSGAFGQLTPLEVLDVSSNAMTGTLPVELEALSRLQELNVSNNPFLTGVIPSGLCTLELLAFTCESSPDFRKLCGCDCACVGDGVGNETIAVGSNASSTTMAPATQLNTTQAPAAASNTSGTTVASVVAANETNVNVTSINATEMVVVSTGKPSNQTGVAGATTVPSVANSTNGNTTEV